MRYTSSVKPSINQHIQLQANVPPHLHGMRLDQALAQLFPEHSRARLQVWIRAKEVKVDGQLLKPKDKIHAHQLIEIDTLVAAQTTWQAQPIALDIIYEDDAIIVVNKPPGLVVHPAIGNPDRTLVNALLHHAPELAQLPRAGIIHRLDKATSGLLVIARTLTAHTYLVTAMQARAISREYLAVVNGNLISGGSIDAPIARHPVQRKQMAVVATGKPAVTHYRIAERFQAHTLLDVRLETGRTHQIRVHMMHINHPVVGDPSYGGRLRLPKASNEQLRAVLQNFRRQALHAVRLSLIHPVTQQAMTWQAPIPDDIQSLIDVLRNNHQQKL